MSLQQNLQVWWGRNTNWSVLRGDSSHGHRRGQRSCISDVLRRSLFSGHFRSPSRIYHSIHIQWDLDYNNRCIRAGWRWIRTNLKGHIIKSIDHHRCRITGSLSRTSWGTKVISCSAFGRQRWHGPRATFDHEKLGGKVRQLKLGWTRYINPWVNWLPITLVLLALQATPGQTLLGLIISH